MTHASRRTGILEASFSNLSLQISISDFLNTFQAIAKILHNLKSATTTYFYVPCKFVIKIILEQNNPGKQTPLLDIT